MDPGITVAIIALVQGLGVAVINGIISRSNKRNDEYRRKRESEEAAYRVEREERDRRREVRDAKLYNLVFANSTGTEVLLHQAHGDHLNGNVEQALRSIQRAKGDFNSICNQEVAKL